MNKHICNCGTVIPDERIAALTLNGKRPEWAADAKCKDCAEKTVKRKAGYHVSATKLSKGPLVIADQDTVDQFYKDSARPTGHTTAGTTRTRPPRKGWM